MLPVAFIWSNWHDKRNIANNIPYWTENRKQNIDHITERIRLATR